MSRSFACVGSRLVSEKTLFRIKKLIHVLKHRLILQDELDNKVVLITIGTTPFEKEMISYFETELKAIIYRVSDGLFAKNTISAVHEVHYNSRKLHKHAFKDMCLIYDIVGSADMVIAAPRKSGCGRATFALQLASSMFIPYIDLSDEESNIRIENITKQIEKETKRKCGVTQKASLLHQIRLALGHSTILTEDIPPILNWCEHRFNKKPMPRGKLLSIRGRGAFGKGAVLVFEDTTLVIPIENGNDNVPF